MKSASPALYPGEGSKAGVVAGPIQTQFVYQDSAAVGLDHAAIAHANDELSDLLHGGVFPHRIPGGRAVSLSRIDDQRIDLSQRMAERIDAPALELRLQSGHGQQVDVHFVAVVPTGKDLSGKLVVVGPRIFPEADEHLQFAGVLVRYIGRILLTVHPHSQSGVFGVVTGLLQNSGGGTLVVGSEVFVRQHQ
jgi:hypothetical protein